LSQTGGLDTAHQDWTQTLAAMGTGASSNGIYMLFQPRGANNFNFPYGYMQKYLESGTYTTAYNQLDFWFKSDTTFTRRADGGDTLQIGTYIRPHDDTNYDYQGQHYYHGMDPNVYAGKKVYVFLLPQPTHQVTESGAINHPYDPEWNAPTVGSAVHYYDGMTNWYFDGDPNGTWNETGSTWTWGNFKLDSVNEATEPIATVQGSADPAPVTMHLASSVTTTYNPTAGAFEVSW